MKVDRCRGCPAPVIWVVLDSGKRMPVDEVPHAGGNVKIWESRGVQCGRVLGPLEVEMSTDELHTSHFVTCPDAASFRRKR